VSGLHLIDGRIYYDSVNDQTYVAKSECIGCNTFDAPAQFYPIDTPRECQDSDSLSIVEGAAPYLYYDFTQLQASLTLDVFSQ